MGGQDPFFEEAKVSTDPIDIMYSMFQSHPIYTCSAIGSFILAILIFVFLQREHVHITTNPEVQWHLKHIKKEEEELKEFGRKRFKEEQAKNRHKRREYDLEYRQEELAKLSPEERQRKEDKRAKKKEYQLMKEQDLYNQVLRANNQAWLPKEQEITVRKIIRKDVRDILKVERMDRDPATSDSSVTDDEDWERKI